MTGYSYSEVPQARLFSSVTTQALPAPRATGATGVTQNLSYNAAGGASVESSPFADTTNMIQVCVWPSSTGGIGIRYEYGSPAPNASANSGGIPSGSLVYLCVRPGEVFSVISADSNTGDISIVECA